MSVIKSISNFMYTGKVYNLRVSEAGVKGAISKSLFDDYVHPDYKIYHNDSQVLPISETKLKDIIICQDSKHWQVDQVMSSDFDGNLLLISFTDGRQVICSKDQKFTIVNPKKITAKNLEVSDNIKDIQLEIIGKIIRSTKRS